MNTRSKSTLFLIEQLIVIAVFAICAAACISILASAYFMSEDTRDISSALLIAESGAEAYKATGGDLQNVAAIIDGGSLSHANGLDILTVGYDENWKICEDDNPVYILRITSLAQGSEAHPLRTGDITVTKLSGGPDADDIVSFPIVARID